MSGAVFARIVVISLSGLFLLGGIVVGQGMITVGDTKECPADPLLPPCLIAWGSDILLIVSIAYSYGLIGFYRKDTYGILYHPPTKLTGEALSRARTRMIIDYAYLGIGTLLLSFYIFFLHYLTVHVFTVEWSIEEDRTIAPHEYCDENVYYLPYGTAISSWIVMGVGICVAVFYACRPTPRNLFHTD